MYPPPHPVGTFDTYIFLFVLTFALRFSVFATCELQNIPEQHEKIVKTTKWIGYVEKVALVLRFQRATKENNLDLHLACLEDIVPLYFACDHHNYARYLVVHLINLLNLQSTHPGAEILLRNNGFQVQEIMWIITIEQTINRHAKCIGGIVGFSRRFSAYAPWCITRHERAKYVQLTF